MSERESSPSHEVAEYTSEEREFDRAFAEAQQYWTSDSSDTENGMSNHPRYRESELASDEFEFIEAGNETSSRATVSISPLWSDEEYVFPRDRDEEDDVPEWKVLWELKEEEEENLQDGIDAEDPNERSQRDGPTDEGPSAAKRPRLD